MNSVMSRFAIFCPRAARAAMVFAVGLCSAMGQAHAAPNDETARAKTQFEQGRAAVKSGDLARARSLFLSSQGLVPKTATLMNLADCEERLGLFASALQHFQEAILLAPPGDDRVGPLKQRARALEPRVPKLRIDSTALTSSKARILLDARDLSADAVRTPQSLDPGQYTVTVVAPGYKDRDYAVRMKEGESTVIVVEQGEALPKPRPPSKPVAPPPQQVGLGKLQIAGLAVGGVGVAGLVVGAVTGMMAVSRKGQLEGECPVPTNCSKEGMALAREGTQLGTVSTVGLAVGGGALVLGAAAFAVRLGTPAASASVSVGPNHGSIALRWAF